MLISFFVQSSYQWHSKSTLHTKSGSLSNCCLLTYEYVYNVHSLCIVNCYLSFVMNSIAYLVRLLLICLCMCLYLYLYSSLTNYNRQLYGIVWTCVQVNFVFYSILFLYRLYLWLNFGPKIVDEKKNPNKYDISFFRVVARRTCVINAVNWNTFTYQLQFNGHFQSSKTKHDQKLKKEKKN